VPGATDGTDEREQNPDGARRLQILFLAEIGETAGSKSILRL